MDNSLSPSTLHDVSSPTDLTHYPPEIPKVNHNHRYVAMRGLHMQSIDTLHPDGSSGVNLYQLIDF